jgi:hypothetical protein
MKKLNISLCAIITAVLLLTAGVPVSGASAPVNPNSYTVDDGLLYDADGKQFEGAEVVEVDFELGKIYWLAVDPDADGSNEGLYEGWAGGIYFFGSDGNFISMLGRKNAQMSYVNFCPDGSQFALSGADHSDYAYELHEFEGLKLKKTFSGLNFVWIDNMRFAFTLIDESKGARHENADIPGWLTVAVFDSAVDLLTTVTEATKTESFMVNEYVEETGELVVMKISVKDEKDWADEDRQEIEEIRVPVPPAG